MEKRRDQMELIEKGMPNRTNGDALAPVFRRLDAIQQMVGRRAHRKGGCIVGNLSTALSATHNSFRRRLADCLDAMALEFKPHLDAAAKKHCPKRPVDTWDLARYVVTVIEGAILLARTHQDRRLLGRHFDHLKQYIRQSLRAKEPQDAGRFGLQRRKVP